MIEAQVSRVPFCKAGQPQEGKGEAAEVGKAAQAFPAGTWYKISCTVTTSGALSSLVILNRFR